MTEQLDLIGGVEGTAPCPASEDGAPIYLERIDPAQNMRRFYSLSLQPSLFGELGLVRSWGRIGTRGQCRTEWFDDAECAIKVLTTSRAKKRRRGYVKPTRHA